MTRLNYGRAPQRCAMNPELSVRAQAVQALIRFEESSTSMKSLLREMQTASVDSVRVQSLALSVIRYRNTIDFLLIRAFGKSGIQKLDIESKNILRLLLYETKWLNIDLDEELQEFPASKQFLNRLRKVIALDLEAAFQNKPDLNRLSLLYSHPTFLVKTLLDNLSVEETTALLDANNQRRTYYVRPNSLHTDSQSSLDSFGDDVILESIPEVPTTSQVVQGIDKIINSQHFKDGKLLIQDFASVLVVKSLDPQPGEKVWDSCAAPGMKTQLIAELMQGQGEIIATDMYEERVKTAQERAQILNASQVKWLQSDATKPEVLDADRILIDAPCTSTGILQAYPSFKWRLNKETTFALMTIQNKLLDGILTAYRDKPGTEIVFSTCSILPHEGESQIDSAMKRHDIELLEPFHYGRRGYSRFKCSRFVKRLFPHEHKTSGFFIAKMRIKQ